MFSHNNLRRRSWGDTREFCTFWRGWSESPMFVGLSCHLIEHLTSACLFPDKHQALDVTTSPPCRLVIRHFAWFIASSFLYFHVCFSLAFVSICLIPPMHTFRKLCKIITCDVIPFHVVAWCMLMADDLSCWSMMVNAVYCCLLVVNDGHCWLVVEEGSGGSWWFLMVHVAYCDPMMVDDGQLFLVISRECWLMMVNDGGSRWRCTAKRQTSKRQFTIIAARRMHC